MFRRRSDGVPVFAPDGAAWRPLTVQPRRKPESLVLPDGLLEDLQSDLWWFLGAESWYAARGIPWRRSLLLSGPPGTGKSATVHVLASELGLGIAALSLKDPAVTGGLLRRLVAAVPARTLLLLEDVDRVWTGTPEPGAGATLSDLLAALDGLGSPHGLVSVQTANHPEVLDPALVRPGRADRRVEFGHCTRQQAATLFFRFYRDHPLGSAAISTLADQFGQTLLEGSRIAPARVQEHLLRFPDNPQRAYYTALASGIVWESREGQGSPQRPARAVPAAVSPVATAHGLMETPAGPPQPEPACIAEIRQSLASFRTSP